MPCVIRQKEDNIDMKELSKIALAVEPSSTMAIDTLFKQMKAEGQDVIGFGAGEPDFNTPDYIKEAGIAAIEHNETRYTPSSGTVELRKAICQRLKADCGVVARQVHFTAIIAEMFGGCALAGADKSPRSFHFRVSFLNFGSESDLIHFSVSLAK